MGSSPSRANQQQRRLSQPQQQQQNQYSSSAGAAGFPNQQPRQQMSAGSGSSDGALGSAGTAAGFSSPASSSSSGPSPQAHAPSAGLLPRSQSSLQQQQQQQQQHSRPRQPQQQQLLVHHPSQRPVLSGAASAPPPTRQYYLMFGGPPILINGARAHNGGGLGPGPAGAMGPTALFFWPGHGIQRPHVPPPQVQQTVTIRNEFNLKKQSLSLRRPSPAATGATSSGASLSASSYFITATVDASIDFVVSFYVCCQELPGQSASPGALVPSQSIRFHSLLQSPPISPRKYPKGLGCVVESPVPIDLGRFPPELIHSEDLLRCIPIVIVLSPPTASTEIAALESGTAGRNAAGASAGASVSVGGGASSSSASGDGDLPVYTTSCQVTYATIVQDAKPLQHSPVLRPEERAAAVGGDSSVGLDQAHVPSVRVLKQKILVQGKAYELQEIYGMDEQPLSHPQDIEPSAAAAAAAAEGTNNPAGSVGASSGGSPPVRRGNGEPLSAAPWQGAVRTGQPGAGGSNSERVAGSAALPGPSASPFMTPGGSTDHDHASSNEDAGLCVICLTERRDTALLPCRHMCLCHECAKVLRLQTNKCPICRGTIESLLHIKLSATNNATSSTSSPNLHSNNMSNHGNINAPSSTWSPMPASQRPSA